MYAGVFCPPGLQRRIESIWSNDGPGFYEDLLDRPENQKIHRFFREINAFYKKTPALWEIDFDWEGFEWLVSDDNSDNVVVFLRRDKKGTNLLCAINFSPNVYEDYRFGCPPVKEFVEVFNTDEPAYGGTGVKNDAPCKVSWKPSHDKECSVSIKIPPLGAVFLVGQGKLRAKPQRKKVAVEKVGTEKKAAPKSSTKDGKTVKRVSSRKKASSASE